MKVRESQVWRPLCAGDEVAFVYGAITSDESVLKGCYIN